MSKQPEQLLKVCSICAKKFEGWGNSAMPIKKGGCCNACADRVVIPARIAQMRAEKVNGVDCETGSMTARSSACPHPKRPV